MCSVDSETNNVFEENSTQKHQFLFVYCHESQKSQKSQKSKSKNQNQKSK